MLPLPELDNESFQEIIEEARRKIPGLTSEWTDFNYHDPGITIVQLMAWLKEMQQFYIDSIGDLHRLKYLKLLGCSLLKEAPACVDTEFKGAAADTLLPAGTKLDANGICFETESPLMLLDNEIICAYSGQHEGIVELACLKEWENGIGEYIFGQNPEPGNVLLLGFRRALPVGQCTSLLVSLSERKDIKARRNPGKPVYPLALLQWEYWDGVNWRAVNLIEDQTEGFIIGGYVRFSLEGHMQPSQQTVVQKPVQQTVQQLGQQTAVQQAVQMAAQQAEQPSDNGEELFWLRCVLSESNYSIAPYVESITLNSVKACQKDTLCEFQQFDGTGEENQSIIPGRFMQLTGNIEVQIYEDGWWKTCYRSDLQNEKCSVFYDDNNVLDKVVFSEEKGCVPKKCSGNIRIISWTEDFHDKVYISGSSGHPAQEHEIGLEQLLEDSFEIQIGKLNNGEMLWRDWEKTDDLMTANSNDSFYKFDALKGVISFGDGEKGEIPSKGDNNIRIISCATTQGSRGNVRGREINSITGSGKGLNRQLSGIQVRNSKYAEGGRDRETIENAILRFRKSFDVPERAVTAADYEAIVRTSPGLMIDMVKAIPNYLARPKTKGISAGINCVTVVVKPFSTDTTMPSINAAYKKNIMSRLEQYRMVTTQVDVVSPRYFGLDVYCMLVVKPYYKDAEKSIHAFLGQQLNGTSSNRSFGACVVFGEIYGRLESLDCVDRITSLSIEPHESGIYKKAGGDIEIPPDGLTYLRSVTLDIKERMR